MACLGQLWKDVWPIATSVAAVAGWQHWRIKVLIDKHMVQVTATLNRKLKVQVEVEEPGAVKIVPIAPDADAETQQ